MDDPLSIHFKVFNKNDQSTSLRGQQVARKEAPQFNCNTENFKKMELGGNAPQGKVSAKSQINDQRND